MKLIYNIYNKCKARTASFLRLSMGHFTPSLTGRVGVGLVGLLLCSCSEDDLLITAPVASVEKAGTWVDQRDGHEYGVVRIGQQEWITENLAYYLPTGTAGGCFTWDEKEGDYKLEDVTFDPDTVQIVITDVDYADVYASVVNDGRHDWLVEDNVTNATLEGFLTNYFSLYGQEAFTTTMAYFPHFHEALVAALDERRNALRGEQLAALEEKCRAIAIVHRDKAEASNGGYARRYGYLYSLDGARAAVPEEGGWRLPTDDDWMALEASLGLTPADQQALNAWRGAGAGTLLLPGGAAGFNALFGGCNAYQRTNERQYIRQGQCAYFWADYETTTSEEQEVSGDNGETSVETFIYRIGMLRQLAVYSDAIWRGTTRVDNIHRTMNYSVRLVRDVAR